MRLKFIPLTALRYLSTAILLAFTACSAAFGQITVTNSTFPTAGTTLRTATATNPGIAINEVFTPPGGGQNWNLSGLQRGTVKTIVFKASSEGSQAANVPGAELVSTSSSSPLAETYYNVTSGRFEIQATYDKFYDVVPLYLSKISPALPDRYAPLNFFDINQSNSTEVGGSNCVEISTTPPVTECSFSPADFPSALISQLPAGADIYRYQVTKQRLDVVDAWGTMIIPGGSYPVLRMKRTEYTDVRLDGKYPPLGWIDITDVATQAGFKGLGQETTYTFIFVNDMEKEPIAVVTLNNEQNATTNVEYKLTSPLLSVNNVTQTEGNNDTTDFNFTVSLTAPAPTGGVTFDIATANGTTNPATQPSDYTAKSLTSQTIAAGISTYTFTVAVNGDVDVEPDETFFVNVSNVTGAVLDDGQGLGTITNDDVAACAISSASFSNVSACNNNGTPSNPADDFYTADLTVNFSTPPATGTLRIEPGNANVLDVVEIAVGSLTGNSHTFTGVRLKTTGAVYAVEVEFSADNACVRTTTAPAVASCSAAICAISSASFSNVSACNNNGTPSNPADDFYTADLTVNFSTPPATGTLRIEPGNANVLDVVEIAVGSLTGSSHTFTGVRLKTTGAVFAVEVEFSADNACVRTISAPAVASCSAAVCAISSASFSNVSTCNNNGTPSNPADDFYTADLTVNFSTPPATGTLRIEPGNVNVLDVVEIAVGSLTGSSHTFTGVRLKTTGAGFAVEVEFSADNACVRTISAPAVASCVINCTPPAINAPAITQPTCATSTGTIVVNATGSGVLEYSVDGGGSWTTSNTFSGLASNSYNIAVRLQNSPTCLANYSSNPVVLTAATGCNTCVITCPANIVRSNSLGKCGANVTYPAAKGTGNCGTLTYSKASGSFFPVGVTTVTVSSTSGSSCSFTVTVKDVQKPEIKCPSDIYVSTTTCSKVVTFSVTATDNCPGVTVSTVPASGSNFPVGTTTVTATATDASGNKTVSTFKVRVKENKPPVINVKSTPAVLDWPANGSYQTINVSQFVLSVNDNCSSIPVSSVNIYKVTSDEAEDAQGSADGNTRKDIRIAKNCKSVDLRRERRNGGNGRAYTIYLSVKDASGNSGTASYKVYVPATQGSTNAVDNGIAYTVGCDCDDDNDRRSISHSDAADLQSERMANQIPDGFVLEQNYPNPVKSSTIIRYAIPVDANVDLTVFNNLGQIMAKLANGRMSAGMHQVNFDASKLAAGIYTYRLQTIDAHGKLVVINKKMILSK